MKRVVIVRSNPAHTDSRVMKEARTLSQKYEVLILGWDREKAYSRSERINGHVLVKRCPIKAPYGQVIIFLYYPIFWIWVVTNLILAKPDVVHACDLDALIPAKIYSVLRSTRIVYDNFDKFAMAFIPPTIRIAYDLVDWLEDILACQSDLLILVSSDRVRTFRWIPEKTILVLNCPETKRDSDSLQKIEDSAKNYDLVLVYTGVIAEDRGLLLLEQAITHIDGIRVLIAGRPVSKRVLNQLLRNPKIDYFGVLSPDKAIELQTKADVIPILYDPEIPINQVASPNKLFEAMMLGVPVISNVCRNIIQSIECGLVVEYEIESFEDAIHKFIYAKELIKTMGSKGREAFDQSYNWEIMESRLLRAYHSLLHPEL